MLRVDPELPVAAPRAADGDYRPTVEGPDGPHFVRLFERLHGRRRRARAATTRRARLRGDARAAEPRAARLLPSGGRAEAALGPRHAPELRPLLALDRRRASGAGSSRRVLDRFEERVAPRWPRLRAQVVHGDLNLDNVLLDDERPHLGHRRLRRHRATPRRSPTSRSRSPRSCADGRRDDVFRVGAHRDRRLRVADPARAGRARAPRRPRRGAPGHDRGDQRLARRSAIRRTPSTSRPGTTTRGRCSSCSTSSAPTTSRSELGAPRPPAPTAELARRRARGARPGAHRRSPTTSPVHVVRGEGVWLIDADGRRLLDAYNNVPGRRPLPPARDRGGRPPDARAQHPRALPVRAADRARRAADRLDAARGRASTR